MVSPFLNADAWSGGTFDVLLYFGPTSLPRTIDITRRIWSFPQLNGPFRHRNLLPSQQNHVDPDFSEDGCEQLVGEFKFPDGAISPFVQTTIRDEDGLWVYAGIPMGGFPANWNVGAYPFDDGQPVDWILDLNTLLRNLTNYVRDACPMLAVAYGWFDVSILDTIGDALNGVVRDDRWHELEVATDEGWQIYSITKLEPLFRNSE